MKIREVEGDIIETTGGNSYAYAQKEIINSSEEVVSQVGAESGVKYGKPLIPILVYEESYIVHFRPNRTWKGEFGFDWVRNGTDSTVQVDERYSDIVGKYGMHYATSKKAKFIKSFQEYFKCVKEYNVISSIREKYYIPFLTLLGGQEVTLDLYYRISKITDSVEFDYNKELFTVILNQSHPSEEGTYYNANAITIRALKSFNKNQSIKIVKIEDGIKSIVGELVIVKNGEIKNVKILLINVSYPTIDGQKDISPEEILVLRNSLNQAYILPDIEELSDDLVVESNWYDEIFFTAKTKGDKKVLDDSNIRSIVHYFDDIFMNEKENDIYNMYYRIYSVPNSKNLNGIAGGVGNEKAVVVFGNRDNTTTVSHELLHAMGLYHSFDNDAGYTFEIYKTDNIMDYSHHKNKNRFTTTIWQWRKLNDKL
ncbi:hypothetical protein [Myroides sp. DF42-4-2]|uniref:hypothetical protein n=1 Tax=Myroides sp. DF42-4-2 TaxID=2746726 RepID=UPI00257657A3|nr:hypothetical protein [Myroides sp. DF42-4-2]MDM1409105.1 hypothetical protein [Myroides sp. DF42-4-2]